MTSQALRRVKPTSRRSTMCALTAPKAVCHLRALPAGKARAILQPALLVPQSEQVDAQRAVEQQMRFAAPHRFGGLGGDPVLDNRDTGNVPELALLAFP
jgi:hypothetical protein